MKKLVSSLAAILFFINPLVTSAQAPSKSLRNIGPLDIYRMSSISNPKISPEGNWIMYSVSKIDSAKDKFYSKLYMVSADGKETISLTEQTKGVSNYHWSPDGKYISFLAAGKEEEEGAQLYLMDRRGGEPFQITHIKGELEAYNWFKDGKHFIFTIKDFNYADSAKSKVKKPYEIDRYHFKADNEGYLDNRKTHLYSFELASKKLDTLTKGNYNESDVTISKDGKMIAYASNVSEHPDQNDNTSIFLLSLSGGQNPVRLTTYKGSNRSPKFSPDNNSIAFLQASSEDPYNMYDLQQLGMIDVKTKAIKILTKKYDRSFENITWSMDSQSILATVEDDRSQNIMQVNVASGDVKFFTHDMAVYSSLDINEAGTMAVLYSNTATPNEIMISQNNNSFQKITHLQDAFLAPLKKIVVKGISSMASDKNKVNGILYLPDSNAKKLPLLLFIHGGPVAQDEYSFDMTRQIYAAAGYAVAAVNYRGSSGRGADYTKTIYADWGNKEVKDIIGIANYLIKEGIADSTKLAIAGWSYGGILTNYTIATDTRFKAAVSGAGSSLMLSFYGTDQYIAQYEPELGKPWENMQKWIDVSYPFFKVKEIKTPTLFMASQADFNVPVVGAEQMYQAFKSVGIPTQLIIYPNQNHGIRVPSYLIHRYNSHINWFKTYLK
ncbi:MAG: S9 family peptidase [Chitinophagia bacterium]|jgi:dipeptidyl aminopeptidase/acylaminoacyl peptidase